MEQNTFKRLAQIGKVVSLVLIVGGGTLALKGESLQEYRRGIIDSPYEKCGAGLMATGVLLPLAGMAYLVYRESKRD